MRLSAVHEAPSPDTPGCLRVTGVIALDGGEELPIWVDLPGDRADAVAISGNPWVVAMLPLAASRGENIKLEIPVDALLLENLRGVLAIWREWYPELHDVSISCPVASYVAPPATGLKTAAFFSGGIDSYFTIARHMSGTSVGLPAVGEVHDLVSVWGFDVRVGDEAQFAPLAAILSASAKTLGLGHLIVRTNLRSIEKSMPFKDAWRRLSHGAGLAFVGLVLERAYQRVLIGSSFTFGGLFPWGSHPMLDPLFSTSRLQFVHDGASLTRVEKTDLVGRFLPAMKGLHVCLGQGISNCSHCDKCYRTMMTLDVLGHREQAAQVFDWNQYNVSAIRKLFIRSVGDWGFVEQILLAANARGRQDVVAALRHASIRSRLLLPLVKASEWLMNIPGIWRLGILGKAFLMKGPIRKI